jgi:hypothetical protein
MKVGDLVVLRGTRFSSWEHTNENAVVINVPDDQNPGGFFVMFGDGDISDYSGYEQHFEVINTH